MGQIDELLIEAKRVCGERWQKAPEYPWEVAAQFGAEVERLRVEGVALRVLLTAREKTIELTAQVVAKLEAENAELRKDRDEHVEASIDLCAERDALKARLAWFEERDAKLRELVDAVEDVRDGQSLPEWRALKDWEREHPKPEGT